MVDLLDDSLPNLATWHQGIGDPALLRLLTLERLDDHRQRNGVATAQKSLQEVGAKLVRVLVASCSAIGHPISRRDATTAAASDLPIMVTLVAGFCMKSLGLLFSWIVEQSGKRSHLFSLLEC